MPNVLYRRSMKKQKLGGVKVEKDDFVLVCQGSAMADAAERGKDQDWFYGDRAPKNGKAKTAPHFCPGYKMADSMLETMSSFLLERTDLRRADETGTLLSYAWVPENKKMDYVKALIAQKKRADQK